MGSFQDNPRHSITLQSYLSNLDLNPLASKAHTWVLVTLIGCLCKFYKSEDISSEEIQITELCDTKIYKIIIHSAPD